jgi:hypothetical protein
MKRRGFSGIERNEKGRGSTTKRSYEIHYFTIFQKGRCPSPRTKSRQIHYSMDLSEGAMSQSQDRKQKS